MDKSTWFFILCFLVAYVLSIINSYWEIVIILSFCVSLIVIALVIGFVRMRRDNIKEKYDKIMDDELNGDGC